MPEQVDEEVVGGHHPHAVGGELLDGEVFGVAGEEYVGAPVETGGDVDSVVGIGGEVVGDPVAILGRARREFLNHDRTASVTERADSVVRCWSSRMTRSHSSSSSSVHTT